jgi:hypothetical protein
MYLEIMWLDIPPCGVLGFIHLGLHLLWLITLNLDRAESCRTIVSSHGKCAGGRASPPPTIFKAAYLKDH